MWYRRALELLILSTVLVVAAGTGRAEERKYRDWKGEWTAIVPRMEGQQLRFDPSKPYGRRQDAPLTEEYKQIYQESLNDQALGGQGLFLDHASCRPRRHADHDVNRNVRIHHNAGNDLYLGRHRVASSFYRWTPMADRPRTDVSGLFHRHVDR